MTKYSNAELCLLWLDSFNGLEYKHKKEIYKLINGKDSIKELLVKSKEYIILNVGENEYNNLINSANQPYLSYLTETLSRKNITCITIESEDYPLSLKDTPFAPLVLYTKGDVSLLKSECFAMVGSRKCLPISVKLAERFATELSTNGFTLVTGIAQGIDETVLKAGLETSGKVISVLGGGFDVIYPKSNTELVDKIAEKGLVISEYPPEVVSKPHHFPIRNRIIAGLSKGVLVVSAGMRSGTQYTANYAMEYGRDLFAIPYSIGIESGAGCNDLIKRGALLVDSVKDVLEFYNIEEKQSIKREFTADEHQIITALSEGEMHVEKLCRKIGRQAYEILPLLSALEIEGIVSRNGINVFGLTDSVTEE